MLTARCPEVKLRHSHRQRRRYKIKHMRYFTRLSFLLCLLVLSGCLVVPIPHKRLHEVGIKGRIIDAESHAPVVAAKVEDTVDPMKFTYSVIDGTFDLKPVYKMHGAYVLAGVSAWVSLEL